MHRSSRAPLRRAISRRGWIRAAVVFVAIAVAAAVGYVVGEAGARRSSGDPAARFAQLATRQGRPTVARLAGFPWAPAAETLRGSAGAPAAELLALGREIRSRAAADPSAENRHALALVHLAVGELDEAIELLAALVLESPRDDFGNDLAAALLARGRRDQRPERAAAALEHLEARARRADVVFNRALALDELGLVDEAAAEWNAYLVLDAFSPWASEARERAAGLRVAADPGEPVSAQELERRLLDTLLPRWALESATGDVDAAARTLREAGEVATRFATAHGDRLLSEAVALAAGAGAASSPRVVDRLEFLARARASYSGEDLGTCVRGARAARGGGASAGDAVHVLAQLTEASCAYLDGDFDRVSKLAAAVAGAERAGPRRSPIVLGQAAWLRALAAMARQRPLEALESYGESLAELQRARDRGREAAVRGLLADLYDYLGRTDEAWFEISMALRLHAPLAERRFQLAASLYDLAVSAELPRVALRAARAAERAAGDGESASFAAEALLLVGEAQARLAEGPDSITTLRAALSAAESIPDAGVRRRLTALASLKLARASMQVDTAAAEALLAATPATEETDLYLDFAATRAALARRRGDLPAAEGALRAALARSAREMAILATRRERDALFARREELELALLDLLLDADRGQDAFAVVEQWRSVAIARLRPGAAEAGGRGGADLPTLPPGTVGYSFVSLERELLVWEIDERGPRLDRRPVGREALRAAVRANVESTRRGTAAPESGELARWLFGDRPPAAGRRLVFFPDAVLYGVPFAALAASQDGEPLMVAHEIVVAPSYEIWRRSVAPGPGGERCALLLAGARGGGALFPGLARLGRVDDELAAVAASYACAQRIGAPEELERRRRDRPAVVHFAGHSVTTGDAGGFLLFGDTERPLAIGVEALERWNLADALVVLSSCASAEGRSSVTAGRDGPAQALLVAGASAVVGSLWPVDDEAAFEFSTLLHGHLGRGEPAARALQLAQGELRRRGRPARAWAAWRLVGSDTAELSSRRQSATNDRPEGSGEREGEG